MDVDALEATLNRAYDTRVPLLIEGPPGIGKTYLVREFARRQREKYGRFELRTAVTATMSPLDICTYMPVRGESGTIGRLKPFFNSLWPDINDPEMEDSRGIIFLDEFGHGLPEVQNALQILIQLRQLGDLRMPEGWSFVAATNRPQDRAGAGRFGTAMANRFSIVTLDFSPARLYEYSLMNGWNPLVVTFIEHMKNSDKGEKILYSFSPEKTVFSSPRQWEKVSNDMDYMERTGTEPHFEYLAGMVEEGPAREFETVRKFWSRLPPLASILSNPGTADVPSKPDEQYAVGNMLAVRTTSKNVSQIVQYVDRLPDEIAIRLIKLWADRSIHKKFSSAAEDFTRTTAFNKWFMSSRYQEQINAVFAIAA